MTVFRLFQTQSVCRRQSKIDENGRKFIQRRRKYCDKSVENTVGNGEIARDEQFLLFTHCFKKTCTSHT